jgi:hypothetical protein
MVANGFDEPYRSIYHVRTLTLSLDDACSGYSIGAPGSPLPVKKVYIVQYRPGDNLFLFPSPTTSSISSQAGGDVSFGIRK